MEPFPVPALQVAFFACTKPVDVSIQDRQPDSPMPCTTPVWATLTWATAGACVAVACCRLAAGKTMPPQGLVWDYPLKVSPTAVSPRNQGNPPPLCQR